MILETLSGREPMDGEATRIRCVVSERTVHIFHKLYGRSGFKRAKDWCRRNGYSWMPPVGPRDPEMLENKAYTGW